MYLVLSVKKASWLYRLSSCCQIWTFIFATDAHSCPLVGKLISIVTVLCNVPYIHKSSRCICSDYSFVFQTCVIFSHMVLNAICFSQSLMEIYAVRKSLERRYTLSPMQSWNALSLMFMLSDRAWYRSSPSMLLQENLPTWTHRRTIQHKSYVLEFFLDKKIYEPPQNSVVALKYHTSAYNFAFDQFYFIFAKEAFFMY